MITAKEASDITNQNIETNYHVLLNTCYSAIKDAASKGHNTIYIDMDAQDWKLKEKVCAELKAKGFVVYSSINIHIGW